MMQYYCKDLLLLCYPATFQANKFTRSYVRAICDSNFSKIKTVDIQTEQKGNK